MAEGLFTISLANSMRFAKVDSEDPCWENTLVCQESNPDGHKYGYAQRVVTGDVLKIYFKSDYATFTAQLYDELDAAVGSAISVVTESSYATYSYFSVEIDTAGWNTTKAYYLKITTDSTFDVQVYQSEPVMCAAAWANHIKIEYTNLDTAFELDYANLTINHMIRVPGRLYGYKPEGEIDVYSNQGVLTKIREVVERVQILEIEPVPRYLAEKINIALAHDQVLINGKEFVKKSLPSVSRFSKTNMMTVTAEVSQSYVSGLNSDDEGFDYIGSGGDLWEVIKNFTLSGVTGSQTIDVGAYATNFKINNIVFTLLGGTAGSNKVGLTAGADDVMEETDMSDLVIGNPVSVFCEKIFGAGQDTVYFTLPDVSYDINLTLMRYKA
jgi:hypothetical protein